MGQTMLDELKVIFKDNIDIRYRKINCKEGAINLVFLESLCDSKFISEYIVAPLLNMKELNGDINTVKEEIIQASTIGDANSKEDILSYILKGNVIILFSFMKDIIFCDAKKFAVRAIEKPEYDPVLKGPKESFNELLLDNISLIRKRIANADLRIEKFTLGKKSNTDVALLYINGVAPKDLVQYVRDKLNAFDNEFILGTNYIEEQLKCKNTALDTIGFTEQPDVTSAVLFEGRIAILVNGTPFAMTAPYFFIENFHHPDDNYFNMIASSYFRLIRLAAFFLALLLPGFYIALTTYHFSLIPTSFIFKLASSRAGVPFPSIIEITLMMFFFQLALEAGKRLPSIIGQSLSIVAALILGESAVRAGLTSDATIVIVGIYAISSFINPRLSITISLWSFFILVLSATFGLHGFYISFIVFIAHVASLNSCGYPFLFPLGTLREYKYKEKDFIKRGNLKNISFKILKRGK